METTFGTGSYLLPAVSLGGTDYSVGFRFIAGPSNSNDGWDIVAARIRSATHLGDGDWDLVLDRAPQFSSYTKPPLGPGQGATEVETTHWCGGNVCLPRELWRVLSFNNEPMASRGPLEASRAVPGDGARFDRGGKAYLWEILEAEAYDVAPDLVNYAGEVPSPTIGYANVDLYDVAVDLRTDGPATSRYYDGASIRFEGRGIVSGDPFAASNVYVVGSGGFQLSTRETFVRPGGTAPDPSYLPPAFGTGLSGNRYWWDEGAREVRFIKDALALADGEAPQALLAYFLHGLETYAAVPADNYCIAESAGTVGHSETGDIVCLHGCPVGETFVQVITLHGPAAVSWRRSTGTLSLMAYLRADSAGQVRVGGRADVDADPAPGEVLATLSYPFQVQVQKSGTSLQFRVRQNSSSSWTDAGGNLWPSSLPSLTSGLLGVGRIEAGATAFQRDWDGVEMTAYRVGGAEGTLYLYRAVFAPLPLQTRSYQKPAPEAIVSVFNETAGVAMSAGVGGRDRYQLSGSGASQSVVVGAETSGDRIRITCAAPSGPPAPPGLAPRSFNQPDFAEFAGDPDDPQRASTNLATNRANWRDRIRIRVEDPGWTPVVGEPFMVVRGAGVWSSTSPPTIYVDRRNNTESDWQAVSAADYHLRAYQGLLLLKKGYADALEGEVCIKAEGRRYQPGAWAYNYNELLQALGGMDRLAANVGGGWSGFSAACAGGTSSMSVYGLDYSCYAGANDSVPSFWVPGDYKYGTLARGKREFAAARLGQLACWEMTSGGLVYSRFATDAGAPPEGTLVCQSSPTQPSPLKDFLDVGGHCIPGEFLLTVSPYGTNAAGGGIPGHWQRDNWRLEGGLPVSDPGPEPTNYAGGFCNFSSFSIDTLSSGFRFVPVPYGWADLLRRLPNDATVVDGWFRVRFQGLRYKSWSGTNIVGPRTPKSILNAADYSSWRYYEDGVLIAGADTVEGETTYSYNYNIATGGLWPNTARGGTVGFSLVGLRRDSERVALFDGSLADAPASDFIALGSSITGSEVQDGEWSVIDASSFFRAIHGSIGAEISELQLWPSVASAQPDAGAEGLTGYLQGLMPANTCSIIVGADPVRTGYSATASGRVMWWSSLELGEAFVTIRLGNGEHQVLPLLPPRSQ